MSYKTKIEKLKENYDFDEINLERLFKWGFENCFIEKDIIIYYTESTLLAPGILYGSSGNKHDCILLSVNNKWAWESDNLLRDKIVYRNNGQISLSLINTKDNDIIKIIKSKKNLKFHKAKSIDTYKVKKGIPLLISKNVKSNNEISH